MIEHCIKEAQYALDDDPILTGKLGVSVLSPEEDKEDALGVDVTTEASEDPELNGTLFVEDDCDEIDEELDM